MPDETELDSLAELFRFSEILPESGSCLFFLKQRCVSVIWQRALNMTQSAVSHQLRILKQSRLVKNRREGKSMFYSLADDHVRTMIAQGRGRYTGVEISCCLHFLQ